MERYRVLLCEELWRNHDCSSSGFSHRLHCFFRRSEIGRCIALDTVENNDARVTRGCGLL